MKIVNVLILGLALTAVAGPAAASQKSGDLATCKSAIDAAFGPETRTKLMGIKRRQGPDELRMVVIPAAGERLLVHCFVDEQGAHFLDRDGIVLQLGEFGGKQPLSMNP